MVGSLRRFWSTRLQRKGSEAKRAGGRPWERTVRGCRLSRRNGRRCLSPEAVTRLKARVRESTRRPRGRRLERVAQERRRYVPGGKAYVGDVEVRALFTDWDSGIRRRLRGYLGKPWGPRGDTALRKRGGSRDLAWNTAQSAHGPWRLSRSPALAMALPGSHCEGLGGPRRYLNGSSQPNRRGT